MLSIVVCDDEEYYLNELSKLIKENTPNDINYKLNIFRSGETLLESIKMNKIDILFLDIEMFEINGIEAAKVVKQYIPNCIIFFVTCHNNYIAEIFRLNSFQFLQKPINIFDFKFDYKRALEKYKKDHTSIEVKINGLIRNVMLYEIKYIDVVGREIKIHLQNEIIKHYGKISTYEEKLKCFNFSKVHKSFLINLSMIEAIGTERVYLRGINDYIPIGRSYKNAFLDEYHKYKIGRCL